MKRIWIGGGVVIFCFFSTPLRATQLKSLDLSPPLLFTFEERPVTFFAKVESAPGERAPNLFLVQWDPVRERVIYHWQMMDDGNFGDFQANDNLYTRKIEFNDKKQEVRTFSVVEVKEESEITNLKKSALGPMAYLNIVHRPSFLELMKEVWEKIKGHKAR